MSKPAFVVGAYASLPRTQEDHEQYYQLLGEQSWIQGTEIPYPGNLADSKERIWFAHSVPAHWHYNTITAIPGTMQNVKVDSNFGLASPDEEGRRKALTFFKNIREALQQFNDIRDHQDVAFIEIHSAPTKLADSGAMRRSLEELAELDWCGAKLVIEHCDRYIDGQSPEKGFLGIEEEIELATQAGIGITVNWGRSVVEERKAQAAVNHIQLASHAHVLHGLMFSGAGPEETQYGYSWIDGHLPMAPDEPTSLMDQAAIVASVHAALKETDNELRYLGAKVCVPNEADINERLGYLARIHQAAMNGMQS